MPVAVIKFPPQDLRNTPEIRQRPAAQGVVHPPLSSAVEELIRSEAFFRRLIEASPDLIFLQSEGRIIYANSAALKAFDASGPDELIGRSALETAHPDCREISRELVAQ